MAGKRSVRAIALGSILAVVVAAFAPYTSSGQVADVAALDKLYKDGNYQEAYDGYRQYQSRTDREIPIVNLSDERNTHVRQVQ